MTHSPPAVRDLLQRHGLAPRRDLGQNFVVDPNTVRRIAHLANVGPDDRVVEIGAGLGSLTLALAETGARVLAVEVDHGIVPALREVVADLDRVEVLEADATALGWADHLDRPEGSTRADDEPTGGTHIPDAHEGRPGWVLVANLPYNVATPLVCDVLDHVPAVERLLVMVQKEVAERFAAGPGNRQYGAVSVKVAHWATARIVGEVPASVFVPRPNVTSALVEIVRRHPAGCPDTPVDPEQLFALVRAAFGQRRKMLRRSLAERVTPEQFAVAEVRPDDRPEHLDLAAWCRLTAAVHGSSTAR